jgi:hypothetical protein
MATQPTAAPVKTKSRRKASKASKAPAPVPALAPEMADLERQCREVMYKPATMSALVTVFQRAWVKVCGLLTHGPLKVNPLLVMLAFRKPRKLSNIDEVTAAKHGCLNVLMELVAPVRGFAWTDESGIKLHELRLNPYALLGGLANGTVKPIDVVINMLACAADAQQDLLGIAYADANASTRDRTSQEWLKFHMKYACVGQSKRFNGRHKDALAVEGLHAQPVTEIHKSQPWYRTAKNLGTAFGTSLSCAFPDDARNVAIARVAAGLAKDLPKLKNMHATAEARAERKDRAAVHMGCPDCNANEGEGAGWMQAAKFAQKVKPLCGHCGAQWTVRPTDA